MVITNTLRTFAEIQAALKTEISEEYLEKRTQGGAVLTYISWHKAAELGDQRAPGWIGEVTNVYDIDKAVVVVYRIGVPTADLGVVWRSATGYEAKDTSSYGDPSSNAESMAFRRAWAKHGLGLYLYDKGVAGGEAQAGTREWDGKLRFGKHKDKFITDVDVPVDYLEYLLSNNIAYPDQKPTIEAEIAKRQGNLRPPSPKSAASSFKITARQLAELKKTAEENGRKWEDVKALSFGEFGTDNIGSLGSAQWDLLGAMVEIPVS
jgi:hypothetical protein